MKRDASYGIVGSLHIIHVSDGKVKGGGRLEGLAPLRIRAPMHKKYSTGTPKYPNKAVKQLKIVFLQGI